MQYAFKLFLSIVCMTTAIEFANAQSPTATLPKPRQLSGVGVQGAEDLPQRFSVIFSQAEFKIFVSDPAAMLVKLGYKVDAITVSIRDTVWMQKDKKWGPFQVVRDLPPSQSWGWLCGYEDEMCVCHAVLM